MIVNDLCTDLGYKSILKHGEELCGDHVEVATLGDDSTILVLADGLGSGVKANILSTLTATILNTMISNNLPIEDCVETIAKTLPVCKVRGVAYSTFTIIRVDHNTTADLIQFDNPNVIFLRDGKEVDYPKLTRTIEGKTILESHIELQLDDMFIAMSDGAIYAGVGKSLNFGWQRENISEFAQRIYSPTLSAKMMSTMILDECDRLYQYEPGDDTTIATVRVRRRKPVNLLIGPPADPKDVNKMMALFFAKEGKHIVCGGTTSTLAGQYLGRPVRAVLDYIDPEVPPIAEIEGVDLVTEGVLTMSKVVQYAKSYLGNNESRYEWSTKLDGASRIARLLFEEATDINFYVGKAINPAHQNPDLPINFGIKIQLITELADSLKQMGKQIKVSYF